MNDLKIIIASRGLIHEYENLKRKLFNCNSNIYFKRRPSSINYDYQFSLINNAANYNRVTLDNSVSQSDDTRGCTYTITTWTS